MELPIDKDVPIPSPAHRGRQKGSLRSEMSQQLARLGPGDSMWFVGVFKNLGGKIAGLGKTLGCRFTVRTTEEAIDVSGVLHKGVRVWRLPDAEA